jgi:hypothetical protein
MAKHLYGKKGTKRSRWGKRAQFLGRDGFAWPRRDGLRWPHFALVGVVVDLA